jgi:cytosine/uracil/thiamine/allantoin permease
VIENNSIRDRDALANRLRSRFILIGIISLILSPVIFVVLVVYFILRYGEVSLVYF